MHEKPTGAGQIVLGKLRPEPFEFLRKAVRNTKPRIIVIRS